VHQDLIDFRGTTSVLHTLLVKTQQNQLKPKLPGIIETQLGLLAADKANVPRIWMRRLRQLTKEG
jgi:hypothetical protein